MNASPSLAGEVAQQSGKPTSFFEIHFPPPPIHETLFQWLSILLGIILIGLLIIALRIRMRNADAQRLTKPLKGMVITSCGLILLVIVTAGMQVEQACGIVIESGGSPDPAQFFSNIAMLGTLLLWFAGALSALLIALFLHWSRPATSHHHPAT